MKIGNYFKKYKHIYFIEIGLLIPIIILGIISFFFADLIGFSGQITLYIVIFYLASWWLTAVIIEYILIFLKNRDFPRLKKRFKKKPKVFEYAFFLGLFWATGLFTVAYSQEIKSSLDFFNFLNTFGASIFCYGFASACGWYHYIERIDG